MAKPRLRIPYPLTTTVFVLILAALAWNFLKTPKTAESSLPKQTLSVNTFSTIEGVVNATYECPVSPVIGKMWSGPVWGESLGLQFWGTFDTQPHPGAKAKCVRSNLLLDGFGQVAEATHCEITEPSSPDRYPLPACVTQ